MATRAPGNLSLLPSAHSETPIASHSDSWLKCSNLTACTATPCCRQPRQNSRRKWQQSLTCGRVAGTRWMSAAPHLFDGRRLPQWAKRREVDSSRPGHQGDGLGAGPATAKIEFLCLKIPSELSWRDEYGGGGESSIIYQANCKWAYYI